MTGVWELPRQSRQGIQGGLFTKVYAEQLQENSWRNNDNFGVKHYDLVIYPEIYEVTPRFGGLFGGTKLRIRGTGFDFRGNLNNTQVHVGPRNNMAGWLSHYLSICSPFCSNVRISFAVYEQQNECFSVEKDFVKELHPTLSFKGTVTKCRL